MNMEAEAEGDEVRDLERVIAHCKKLCGSSEYADADLEDGHEALGRSSHRREVE